MGEPGFGGGNPGLKLLAPRPVRSSRGKNSFLLLVNFLFVTIFFCVRSGIISIPEPSKLKRNPR